MVRSDAELEELFKKAQSREIEKEREQAALFEMEQQKKDEIKGRVCAMLQKWNGMLPKKVHCLEMRVSASIPHRSYYLFKEAGRQNIQISVRMAVTNGVNNGWNSSTESTHDAEEFINSGKLTIDTLTSIENALPEFIQVLGDAVTRSKYDFD